MTSSHISSFDDPSRRHFFHFFGKDSLDNRKANLRLCTFAENCRNARRTARASSKYKAVHWHKGTQKWAAAIRSDNKTYHLGYFTEETAAAKAYDEAAKKLHGEYASLNFP